MIYQRLLRKFSVKRTALYDIHKANKGRMIEFAGFLISYLRLRTSCTLRGWGCPKGTSELSAEGISLRCEPHGSDTAEGGRSSEVYWESERRWHQKYIFCLCRGKKRRYLPILFEFVPKRQGWNHWWYHHYQFLRQEWIQTCRQWSQ